MHLKISSAKWQPFCPGGDELTCFMIWCLRQMTQHKRSPLNVELCSFINHHRHRHRHHIPPPSSLLLLLPLLSPWYYVWVSCPWTNPSWINQVIGCWKPSTWSKTPATTISTYDEIPYQTLPSRLLLCNYVELCGNVSNKPSHLINYANLWCLLPTSIECIWWGPTVHHILHVWYAWWKYIISWNSYYSLIYHVLLNIIIHMNCKVDCEIWNTTWKSMNLVHCGLVTSYGDKDHYNDVIMGTIVSQITSLTIVYSTVYSDADQRKHQCSASLAFVRRIHQWPVNSPHKWPVTRKMLPFDDIIMI